MIDSPLLGLAFLGLLVAAPLVLRRLKAGSPQGVRVLGRTALGKNAMVAVVAIGERRLLVGAGERGVHLLTELDAEDTPDAGTPGATGHIDAGTPGATIRTDDRTDAVAGMTALDARSEEALEALLGPPGSSVTTAGPGIGLVDRLRGMTVRTPQSGRPVRVPFRR